MLVAIQHVFPLILSFSFIGGSQQSTQSFLGHPVYQQFGGTVEPDGSLNSSVPEAAFTDQNAVYSSRPIELARGFVGRPGVGRGLRTGRFRLPKLPKIPRFPKIPTIPNELIQGLERDRWPQKLLDNKEISKEPWIQDFLKNEPRLREYLLPQQRSGSHELLIIPDALLNKEHSEPSTGNDYKIPTKFLPLPIEAEKHVFHVAFRNRGTNRKRTVRIPRVDFLGSRARTVSRQFRNLIPHDYDNPVILVGDRLPYSTQALLPGRLSARTFDNSPRFTEEHIANLRQLQEFTPTQVKVVLLIPTESKALLTMALAGRTSKWIKARKEYMKVARKHGIEVVEPMTVEELDTVLQSRNRELLVVVGHGDARNLFLPTGEEFSMERVLDWPPVKRNERSAVVLLACRTGQLLRGPLSTLAQSLLFRGRAVGVVAPPHQIPLSGKTLVLYEQLVSGSQSLVDILRNLNSLFQLYVWQFNSSSRRSIA